jgi:protein associated with RNAse G/E
MLDLDEFAANAAHYGYPKQITDRAHQAVDELISLIEARQFPFA